MNQFFHKKSVNHSCLNSPLFQDEVTAMLVYLQAVYTKNAHQTTDFI